MDKKLKVAIAAGGTAGHINPAIALADELKSRGHSVTFFGQTTKLEGELVPRAGYALVPLTVSGFDRSHPLSFFSALHKLGKAKKGVNSWFESNGAPDVAIGFGAYVEMPLLTWCASNKIPYLIHEQNSAPGLANKTLAKGASAIAVAFPAAKEPLKEIGGGADKVTVTGNPVLISTLNSNRKEVRRELGIKNDEVVLFICGGSLGAKSINEALSARKDKILNHKNVRVIHSTGKAGFEDTVKLLNLTDEEKKRWDVKPYIDELGSKFCAADVIVSRAGASTIAEIAAVGTPSILVPYPFARADHQKTNAEFLVNVNAAKMVLDSELDSNKLDEYLERLLTDGDKRTRMHIALKNLAQDKAATKLCDLLEKYANK